MSIQQELQNTDAPSGRTTISVSTSFHPGTPSVPYPQDIALFSVDKVFFYVHSQVLLTRSSNQFAGLLSPTSLDSSFGSGQCKFVSLPETSTVLNIVLHALYGLSCTHFGASTPDVLAAISVLAKYGASLAALLAPQTPLLELATLRMHSAPAEFYALAGKYDLYDLGARASAHLLGVQIQDLPASIVETMGPVYLKRLIALQLGRQDALKAVLAAPPEQHAPTQQCGMEDQASLAKAWQLVGAYFIWEMRPELTPISLEVNFGKLRGNITCPLCIASFDKRLAKLSEEWASVKRTI